MIKNRSDTRNFHFIYKTTCKITGNYYVGMHSTDVIDDGYLGSGKRLSRSINKHGIDNHVREIVEMLSDRKSLRAREAEIVNEELLKDPLCMNLYLGGGGWSIKPKFLGENISCALKGKTGRVAWNKGKKSLYKGPNLGRKWSAEIKKKMSESHKGQAAWNKGIPMSDETKKKLSIVKTGQGVGRKRSEETRQKQSEKAKQRELNKKLSGYKMSDETKEKMSKSHMGEKNHFYGKKHTEETLQKLSRAVLSRPPSFKGRKHTPETKEMIRNALKGNRNSLGYTGRKHSEETKKKMSEAHKKYWAERHYKDLRGSDEF